MAFGEGNLHDEVEELKRENKAMRIVLKFLVMRVEDTDWAGTHPASYGYVKRELAKAGVEL